MKTLMLLLILSALSFGQIITKEKRIEKDSTGKEIVREATVITEDITQRNNMITINPLKFFFFYNLSFYHSLNNSVALGFGLQTPTIKGIDGFGINTELRFYPKERSLRGFYIAPNFSYNVLEEVSIVSAGALLGWQWFPGDDFAIGLGIGLDYYFFGKEEGDLDYYNGTAPALRFDIGYAW
ncbi:MAG: hypothetical protein C4539_14365 [Ignavibacteriales bacterium]|nr:MAG: hypothetical protein C4539_14365 [Ignavibacteriales bacterium]